MNSKKDSYNFKKGERTATLVLISNGLLVGFKYLLATLSGSAAILADSLHSLTDVVSSVGILFGLKVSKRKTKRFPYGLYKVENLIALVTSFLILLAGYGILTHVIFGDPGKPIKNIPIAMAGITVTIIWTFIVSRFELNVGRKLESPSLIADGKHILADLLSSVVILIGLIGSYFGLPLDRIAAGLIVVFIGRAGIEIAVHATRVLLDVSIDYDTLNKVKSILQSHPKVKTVDSVIGRNSGRFKFIEAEITLRESNLEKAHQVSTILEKQIRKQISGVDHILIHYEPTHKTELHFATPVQEDKNSISDHFGESLFFAVFTASIVHGKITHKAFIKNPYLHLEKGKGIAVAEWLVKKGIDTVIVPIEFHSKGPGYVFSDAGVSVVHDHLKTIEDTTKTILSMISGDHKQEKEEERETISNIPEKGENMRIAVSAQGNTMDAPMEARFGRCTYFVIYDNETKQDESIGNPGAEASGGAGPKAVEELVKRNVKTILTGRVGGNAQQALDAAGIEVVQIDASTVKEALNQYLNSN